ncbi:MAG: PorT family protein [Bacteroidetes bacterium]|nr:PorT family protein [Bacteroidota bacterium]
MKKYFLAFSSVLLFLAAIQTQALAQFNFPLFGLKGGVNFSTLYAEDVENTKMIGGFNIGFFSKLPVSDFIAIQPEFYYTTKGGEATYKNAFLDGTASFKTDYVELPILLILNVTENLNLQVGPYLSYLLSGKVKNVSSNSYFDFEDNIDTEDFNRFEGGVAVGAGLDLGALGVGIRYNHGLTKVGKEKTFMGYKYTFPNASNGVINVYASFALTGGN